MYTEYTKNKEVNIFYPVRLDSGYNLPFLII